MKLVHRLQSGFVSCFASHIASRLISRSALGSLCVSFLLPAAANAQAIQSTPVQPPAIAELAQMKGPDYLKQLIEGANREGTLNLYTSMTAPTAAKMKSDFERRYPGIKINLWRASSEALLQRTVTEARAQRYTVDVVETNGPEMEAIHRENLLQPVNSPRFQDLIPQAVMPHHEWVATRLNLFVQCFNTKLVKREDLPATFADLLQPRWKGKLGIEAGDSDWLMSVAERLGEDKALKLFRDIVATNGITVRHGHALMADQVIAGEIPLALDCYNFKIDQDRKAGAPVDWISIGPVMARPNGGGVARHAPHPYAALLFYDYMISDAQPLLTGLELVPVSTKIESPLKGRQVQFVDPKRALDEQTKWDKLFNEIFVSKSK
ncbi:MAG TPA: extracellular solute-binding protein [Herbaspirillum sp.]